MPAASYLGGMIGSAVLNALRPGGARGGDRHARLRRRLARRLAPWSAFSLLGVVCFGVAGHRLRARHPELDSAPAWVNAVFLPLIFISGVFYSADSLPGVLKAMAEALPLKHLIDGLSAAIVGGGEPTRSRRSRWSAAGRWPGCCWRCATSAGSDERRRRVAVKLHRHLGERTRLPVLAHQTENRHVAPLGAVYMPGAEHALLDEAEALEGGDGARVARACERGGADQAQAAECEAEDQGLRLTVGAGAPVRAP